MTIYCFPITAIENVIFRKTDITKSHRTIDNTCCVTDSPAHEFCYRHQCYETTRQVVKLLGIPEDKYSQTFQSRLAGDKWLTPYTDVEAEQNACKRDKKISRGYACFCVRLFRNIRRNCHASSKKNSKEHGGKEFLAIPCLNDDEEWCNVVANWITDWSKS